MASIPLPALDVRPPTAQPDELQEYARLMQLKNQQQLQPLQIQAAQQNVQAQGLENQQRQQDLAARQALNQAYQGAFTKDQSGNPTFDPDKLMKNLSTGPAAYQSPQVLEGITKFQKGKIDLQNAVQDLQSKTQDMIGGAANAVKAAGYDRTLGHSLLDSLPPSPQLNQIRAQIDNPDPQVFKQLIDSAIQSSAKQRELGAQETTAQARQTTAQTEQQKLVASMNPQSSLYAPSQASVALGTAPGAAQIQQNEAGLAARKAAAEAAARQPFEMSLQRQKQALAQGDPQAAGQLLVDGDATLSQLKARGSTPEFIQQALNAAHQISGGKYNAQAAEAQFDVAKSPENVRFFGSAKSLTDPGGTLDQLAQAATKIPKNQIPAFNSIEDWAKAATGSGPLAEYAARVLGVADDYSKVMGGGQGSDASRAQAAQLVAAKLSKEGIAGALNGIRGSVNSQVTSRIGKNTVLQRMYGEEQPESAQSGAPKVGDVKTFPNGKQGKWDGKGWMAQ